MLWSYETSWISYKLSQVFATTPPLRWVMPKMNSVQPWKSSRYFHMLCCFFLNDCFCTGYIFEHAFFPSLGSSWWMEVSFGVCYTVSKFHFPNVINSFAAICTHSWILNYFRDYNILICDWHTNKTPNENILINPLQLIHYFIHLYGLNQCHCLKLIYAFLKA